MGNTSDARLASARARRDRELVAIIISTVDRGIDSLRAADGTGAEMRRAQAERAHADAMMLMRLVYQLNDAERNRLEMRLAELRSALDESRVEPLRVRTAGR